MKKNVYLCNLNTNDTCNMEERQTINPASMPANGQLRQSALEHLRGLWLYPVLCTLLFIAVTWMANSLPLVGLLAAMPLGFGFSVAFLQFVRGEAEEDELVTRPFAVFNRYGRWLGGSMLVFAITLLWSLLLIVPGIVKAYTYAMTPFVMHDNPDMPVRECLNRSRRMMDGYKMKLFLLDLSFIGWVLLSIITCGIGMLWVIPYMQTARVEFYEQLKNNK